MKNFVFFVLSRATDWLQIKLSGSGDENDIAHLRFMFSAEMQATKRVGARLASPTNSASGDVILAQAICVQTGWSCQIMSK